MITLARAILDRSTAGIRPTAADLETVPPVQWEVYFSELSQICPDRAEPAFLRRPANALNVEPMQPGPKCRQRTPPEWGDRDARARRWLASGGSPLVLGCCSARHCPRAGGRRDGS